MIAGDHGGWDVPAGQALADGRGDYAHVCGWFVSWATQGPRTFVFVARRMINRCGMALRACARDASLPTLDAL